MSQKTPSISTVHIHHSGPPPAISINSTKSPSTVSSIKSPRESFKPSNDDESTCKSMPKLISRMDDDNSCTTTTTVDSIRVDTNSLQKPTQSTPNDDSDSGSLPKLISRMDDEESSNSNSKVQPVFQNSTLPNYSNSTSNTNEHFFILHDTLKVESSNRSCASSSIGYSYGSMPGLQSR